jgi:DNA-directed RNA polymerase subunit RPC12/RpoP
MSQVTTRTFVCSECGEQLGVSEQASDALLRSGCPLCTSPVEQTDIE